MQSLSNKQWYYKSSTVSYGLICIFKISVYFKLFSQNKHTGGVVVACSPWVWEVKGSIPGQVIPNTLAFRVTLLLTGWCQDIWTSYSTANLPRKHCNIAETCLKWHKVPFNQNKHREISYTQSCKFYIMMMSI